MTPGSPDRRETDDPWLREALKHAPDGDAAVPAAVREAILSEARRAVQTRSHGPSPAREPGHTGLNTVRRWLSAWMTRSTGKLAGALAAGLAVAVVVIGVREDQEPAVTVAQAPAATAAKQRELTANAEPRTSIATAPAPVPSAAAPGSGSADVAAALQDQRGPQAASKVGQSARDRVADATLSDTSERPTAPARKPTASTAPQLAEATPAPAAAAAAAAPPVSLAAAPVPPGSGATPQAAPPTAGAATQVAAADLNAAVAAEAAAAPQRPVAALAPSVQRSTPASPADPLAELQAATASPSTLTWSADGRSGPWGSTQETWLRALREATSGRWRAMPPAETASASAAGAASAVVLNAADGGLRRATVVLVAGAASVEIAGARYTAPLDPAQQARLNSLRQGW